MFGRRVFATLGIAACAPFLTAHALVPFVGQTGTLEETVAQAADNSTSCQFKVTVGAKPPEFQAPGIQPHR